MTEARAGTPILSFGDIQAFEKWLDGQGPSSPSLWLKLAKKNAPVVTLTKAEAIDAAICHGWIDGQLNGYDDHYWLIRFTPRKPRSRWSENNRNRATELMAKGQVKPAGLSQIHAAQADGRWKLAYAPASRAEPPPDFAEALAANPSAADFFRTLTGANRYAILYRIGAAKRPETRARKIGEFIAMLARGETVHG